MTLVTEAPVEELRKLVIDHMRENNHNFTQAAKAIGVTDSALHQFLRNNKGVGVALCLKLAIYLNVSVAAVLHMGGHDDIAKLLSDLRLTTNEDPYYKKLAEVLDGLDDDDKLLIIQNARGLSRVLKESKARYIIGGEENDDKPIKPYHIRRKPKA